MTLKSDAEQELQIVPARPEDGPAILSVAAANGVFGGVDQAIIQELVEAFQRDGEASGYRFCVAWLRAEVVGFTCYGPTPLTDGTYDWYWLGVTSAVRGKGIGSALLRDVEERVRAAGARLLILETESAPQYEAARRLYERHGWTLEARIRDFYARGDDQLIYTKHFS